ICGSLVEVHPCRDYSESTSEQIVTLVHDTASSYLAHSGRIEIMEEHARMAIYFSRYLISLPFSNSIDKVAMKTIALTGYYGLLDYALACWQHHIKLILSCESRFDINLRNEAIQSTKSFFETYGSSFESSINSQPTTGDLLSAVNQWCDTTSANRLSSERVVAIREILEDIDLTEDDEGSRKTFAELNGVSRFKCSKVRCSAFETGFMTQEERDSHVLAHERPFKCATHGCFARTTGYPSKSLLDAHHARFHVHTSEQGLLFPKDAKPSDIYIAASRGDLEHVKAFHSMGISLEYAKKSKGGLTPFVLAARNGHAHVCEYIMLQGIDPYTETYGNMSPIMETIRRGDLELLQLFLYKCPPLAFQELLYPIAAATCEGCPEIFSQLLRSKKVDVRTNFGSILTGICRLSWKDCYMTDRFYKNLHWLFRCAFPDIYKLGGAQPPVPNPQMMARIRPQLLTPSGPQASYLHEACLTMYPLGEFLLPFYRRGDLILSNIAGQNVYHVLAAAANGPYYISEVSLFHLVELLRKLLETDEGAAANVKDISGNLPLHVAAGEGPEILLLMLHTRNLDEENKNGQTVLEKAAAENDTKKVTILIQSGRIDLHRITASGESIYSRITKNPCLYGGMRQILYKAYHTDLPVNREGGISPESRAMNSSESELEASPSEFAPV
ncbi:hypothetical protein F5Y04DRAFT_292375, partial [Hypomontagnella monticulosa]